MTAPPRLRRRDVLGLVAAAAAPAAAARAQAPARPRRLAVVHPSASVAAMREPGFARAFFAELRRHGYDEGAALAVERHSGEGRTDRFDALARAVADSRPDAIFCVTARIARALRAIGTSIPVVAVTADPVAFGLTGSLARPDANITGVVSDAGLEIDAKRLELLHEAAPSATRIFQLVLPLDATQPRAAGPPRGFEAAARRLRVSVRFVSLTPPVDESAYRRAFAELAQGRAQALLVADSAENSTHLGLIIALAADARLPALYPARTAVEQGGLMSYGVDYADLYRRAGAMVAQILGGAVPADIPFYRATGFELAVNRRTAEALGLVLPATLLALADAVVE